MTQERLDFLKDVHFSDTHNVGYDDVTELISALEESQRVESLIVQIFEAGGDLRGLMRKVNMNGAEWVLNIPHGIFNHTDFIILSDALEFILERTRKQEEQQ